MVSTLGELFNQIKSAINKGDENTYRIAHCRLTQAISECNGDIDDDTKLQMTVQPPQTKKASKKMRAADHVNRSPLCFGSGSSKKRRKVVSLSWYGGLSTKELKPLCKAAKIAVSGTNLERCQRLESKDNDLSFGSMTNALLQETCISNRLSPLGSTYELVLRLLQYEHGTTASTAMSVLAVDEIDNSVPPPQGKNTLISMSQDQIIALQQMMSSVTASTQGAAGANVKGLA